MTCLHRGASSWTRSSSTSKSLEAVSTEQSCQKGVLEAPLQMQQWKCTGYSNLGEHLHILVRQHLHL